jgi:hypothetical protein
MKGLRPAFSRKCRFPVDQLVKAGHEHLGFGQPLPDLPTEEVVIHRVVTTTYMLNVLSLLSVIVLGTYVLIWKNPGFGSAGNYVEAFLWVWA